MSVVILESLELRWFERGPLPTEVSLWFTGLPRPAGASLEPERRTDVYLPTPGSPNVSVKLSRGSLETKLRHEGNEVGRPDSTVHGMAERWTKWSWRYADAAGSAVYDAFATEQRDQWIELEKARWQRKYVVRNGESVPVPSNSRVDLGFAIEIVDGIHRGVRWWSVGVDAFGGDDDVQRMMGIATAMLDRDFPLTLTSARSMAYPVWLDRLASS